VPLSAEARETWAALQAEARRHDPAWREVAVDPHAASLLAALRLAGQAGAPAGLGAGEALLTAWRWWWTGPERYWRERRTGADALLTLLRPATLGQHGVLDRALDWAARARRPRPEAPPAAAWSPPAAAVPPTQAGAWTQLDEGARAALRARAEAELGAGLQACTDPVSWRELVELRAAALAGGAVIPTPAVWSPPPPRGPQSCPVSRATQSQKPDLHGAVDGRAA
jgi:hypothetical protein